MHEHLSNFQKILTNLLSIDEKDEEKTKVLVLLSLLSLSFKSLVTSLLVEKRTIKMKEVTSIILKNEILRWKNSTSSSDCDSAMTVTESDGDRRWSSIGSRGGVLSPSQGTSTRSYTTSVMSWNVKSEIAHNAKIG